MDDKLMSILELMEADHPLPKNACTDHLQSVFFPPDCQDEFTHKLRAGPYGYIAAKRLPDGGYAVMLRLATTVAIGLNVEPDCMFTNRYCFKDLQAALDAYEDLKSIQDVPEGWIARRPKPPEDDEREYQRSLAEFRAKEARESSFEP